MTERSTPTGRQVPLALLALLVPIVALVTAVVTLSVTDDPGAATGSAGNAVTIRNFTFAPSPLVVAAGTSVSVTNTDGTAHTLTADDGSFDTGHLDGGAHGSVTLDTPGRYAYHCDIHNYMTGTIEVKG